MARFTKLHLSLAALLVTTVVVSSAQATVYDSKVRRHGGWYVEVEPFWAKANDSFLTAYPFAESDVSIEEVGDIDTTTVREHYFHPEYDWGYRIALGYDYPSCNCCNYGFSLEYTQHSTDDHKDLTGFTELFEASPGPALEPFGAFFSGFDNTDVHAKYDYDFYSIDLLGHKNMTVCGCVDVQWFVGARYVKLDQDWRQHFFIAEDLIDDFGFSTDFVIDHHTKFNGVGPHVGFDAFFPVFCNFGVTTELAGDLLFGFSKNQYNEILTDSDFVDDILTVLEIDEFHADSPNRSSVVPGLTGKVGLAYRATFRNCSSLVIEAGYRGSKYFGIADHSTLMNGQVFEESFNKDGLYHNYSISGPYISLSYHA